MLGKSAATECGLLHMAVHLRGGGIELGARDDTVLVGVEPSKQLAGAGDLGRLATLGLRARIVGRIRFGLGDLAVVVRVETRKHFGWIETRRALLDLRVALRLDTIDFRLGDEA